MKNKSYKNYKNINFYKKLTFYTFLTKNVKFSHFSVFAISEKNHSIFPLLNLGYLLHRFLSFFAENLRIWTVFEHHESRSKCTFLRERGPNLLISLWYLRNKSWASPLSFFTNDNWFNLGILGVFFLSIFAKKSGYSAHRFENQKKAQKKVSIFAKKTESQNFSWSVWS